METIVPVHKYRIGETDLVFAHRNRRLDVQVSGLTTAELLEVLIDRESRLNEGDAFLMQAMIGLHGLHAARNAFAAAEKLRPLPEH